jgi:hypothetical protein
MGGELSSGARLYAMISQIEQRVDKLEGCVMQAHETISDSESIQPKQFGFMRAVNYMKYGFRVRRHSGWECRTSFIRSNKEGFIVDSEDRAAYFRATDFTAKDWELVGE